MGKAVDRPEFGFGVSVNFASDPRGDEFGDIRDDGDADGDYDSLRAFEKRKRISDKAAVQQKNWDEK